MNYDPRVIERFASWHITAVNFICMAMGFAVGSVVAAYASRYAFTMTVKETAEIYSYAGYTLTQGGAYTFGGYVGGLFTGFWVGKFVGFLFSYPLRVNAQLLLLAIRVEEQMPKMPGIRVGGKPPKLVGVPGGYQDAA